MQGKEKKRRIEDAGAKSPQDEHRVLDSAQLFAECNEVQMRHEGQLYRLRLTKSRKLILNK
jgi:hemin uptake protein HemP